MESKRKRTTTSNALALPYFTKRRPEHVFVPGAIITIVTLLLSCTLLLIITTDCIRCDHPHGHDQLANSIQLTTSEERNHQGKFACKLRTTKVWPIYHRCSNFSPIPCNLSLALTINNYRHHHQLC